MKFEKLDWDSNFFNYTVGKIILDENESINLSEFLLKSKEYTLVYLFSKNKLSDNLFKLVDEKVILHQELIFTNESLTSDLFTIKSFDKSTHNHLEIYKLALESGVFSRFKIDENFKSGEFEKLYSRWIALSIEGKLAFDIVIATDKNETVIGFVTLNNKNKNVVDIGLIAVSEEYRGKGIGKKLLQYSINKSLELGFKEIKVVTQFNNIQAMKLYETVGFKIKEKTFVYHYWNL